MEVYHNDSYALGARYAARAPHNRHERTRPPRSFPVIINDNVLRNANYMVLCAMVGLLIVQKLVRAVLLLHENGPIIPIAV